MKILNLNTLKFKIHTLLFNNFILQILIIFIIYGIFYSFEQILFCEDIVSQNVKLPNNPQYVTKEEVVEAFAYQQRQIEDLQTDGKDLWLGIALLGLQVFLLCWCVVLKK